jgi:2-aminobenzoylacetyl-CoA thioesterase
MIQLAKGQLHERIIAVPNSWYPIYIVTGDDKNLLVDAGINLLGPRYYASIGEALGDPGLLNYLFITHSHYDHLGAAHYLKNRIPGIKIGAHKRVAGLLCKESVLKMMNRLSMNHDILFKYNTGGEDLAIKPFGIEYTLKQGDEFDLGGLTCRVYEVPGHTKDSLAFYLPEIKALFPGEAAGVLQGENREMQVEFLSSYLDYINSLGIMIGLNPEIIFIGHGWILTHEDAREFLSQSLAATYRYRKLIERYLDAANGDAELAIGEMAREEYDIKKNILQERHAYMENLTAQVRHIAGLKGI